MKVVLLLAFQFRGKTFPRFFLRWRGQDDEINASSTQKGSEIVVAVVAIDFAIFEEPPSTFRGFIFPSFSAPIIKNSRARSTRCCSALLVCTSLAVR